MSKPNGRRVRLQQFRQQVAEAVLPHDGTVPVELDNGAVVQVRLPVYLDSTDEYALAIRGAGTADELALAVLGEEQLRTWLDSGATVEEFAQVFGAETRAAQERLQQFRYADR